MPAALSYPGVYVEEISSGVRTITGVATSVAAFIGRAAKGPVDKAIDITSFGDFERIFGGLWSEGVLGFAVRDFFLNGGARAVIVRLFNDDGAAAVTAVESIITAAKGSANGKAASDAAKAANKTIQDDVKAIATTKKAAQAASDLIATLANDADANAINAKLAEVKATEPKPTSRQIKVGKLVFAPVSQGSWGGLIRILVTSTPSSVTTKRLAADFGLDPAQLFNLTVADLAPGGITEVYENVTVEDTVNRIDRVLEGSSLIQWAGGDLVANKPDITAFAPTAPATTLTTGDDGFGQKYVDLLKQRADNPDPTTQAVVDATTAYQKALKDTSSPRMTRRVRHGLARISACLTGSS